MSLGQTVHDGEAGRLAAHASALAAIVPRAAHPDGGFGWLGPDNRLALDRPVATWVTCRMTHVAALEVLRGGDGLRPALDVGYAALAGRLRDAEHGGWVESAGPGAGERDATKSAYTHAFVVLAAASLERAGHPGGRALLDEALDVVDTYFWREAEGMVAERWDAAWVRCEEYRGVNANMHTVEAFLAVADVRGGSRHLGRALRVVERVVHGIARQTDWRLPEHFDPSWRMLRDYNDDAPADPFRPYGVTVGHLLEWARLAVDARTALGADAPLWLLDDAVALFDAAVRRGWRVDGRDGFVYTTGFDDVPVIHERMHWVVCEAIAAAWALYAATGDDRYRRWYERFWTYALRHLVDDEHGGWRHELSRVNEPSSAVWWGKPDVYHAYQASLVPLLPGRVSFAGAL